jgi:Flp pilus assembly protein TadG
MNLPTLSRKDILTSMARIKSFLSPRNSRSDKVNLERVYGMCRRRRRGAAAVEFAIVAPLFFLLVFGMIEFGRIIMVQQVITNAAREGARVGVLDPPTGGTNKQTVLDTVSNYLTSAKITPPTPSARIYISTDNGTTWVESEPSLATYGQPVKVTVSVSYENISWLPFSWFGNSGKTLQASTIMRRETVQ